jgi:hypothetical protein
MAALSTGTARDAGDPGFVSPGGSGFTNGHTSSVDGYVIPHLTQCPAISSTVNDPVQLALTLRVPTNAVGIRVWFRYFSSDYWESVCSAYNDSFVILLDSAAPGLPADRNIARDALGNPISVNSPLDTCVPHSTALGPYTCQLGPGDLTGTGYDLAGGDGGATSWAQAVAPVVPGEVAKLRFVIWDAGDGSYDSLVLIDGFEWVFQ